MPEFVLPAEADRCPYCQQLLVDPPDCCKEAQDDHLERILEAADECDLDG